MVVKLNDYRNNKGIILRAYEKGGLNEVRLLCAVSHIHLVAAYSFILEEHQDESVEEARDQLMSFYGVKEIV